MADPDYSTWKLQAAEPNEYAGWMLAPANPEPATAQAPGLAEIARRGATQGVSMGYGDELAGGIGGLITQAERALLNRGAARLTPQAQAEARQLGISIPDSQDRTTLAQDYRDIRDAERQKNQAAHDASPSLYNSTEFAGGLLPMALPGVGAMSRAAPVLSSAGIGALASLGGSNADLTHGEYGRAALDTGIGAGVGGLAGLAARGLSSLAGRSETARRLASADAAEFANRQAQRAFRSARSALGGETSAVLNAYENASKIAANAAGIFPDEMVQAARARLADPRFIELVRDAGQGSLDAGVDRLTGSLASARHVFEDAARNTAPEAVEAAAEEAQAHPIRTQVVPRLRHMASRAIPHAIGAAVGGPGGALVGAGAAMTLGHPGTTMANMMNSPAVRAWGAGLAQRGANLAARGMSAAAGPTALTVSPEVAAMVAALRKPKEPDYSDWTPEGTP